MPGPGGSQINSLMDLVQGQPAPPQAKFGTWAPPNFAASIPLYSGGGMGGMMAAGGGGGGGGGVFSPPQDLAGYFDQYGRPKLDDPRKVAADAGISLADLANGFLPRYGDKYGAQGSGYDYASDKGGFFSIEDLYNTTRQDTPVSGPQLASGKPTMSMQRAAEVPQIATFNQQAPSTNNWRLLGRGPGFIMRNGFVINTQDPSARYGYPAGLPIQSGRVAEEYISGGVPSRLGTGAAFGYPNMYDPVPGKPAYAGWPGAEGWRQIFPGNV